MDASSGPVWLSARPATAEPSRTRPWVPVLLNALPKLWTEPPVVQFNRVQFGFGWVVKPEKDCSSSKSEFLAAASTSAAHSSDCSTDVTASHK